jgi:drug/metabolite transporter (DMT)-like permease
MDTLTFSTLAIVGSVVTLFAVCTALGVPLWNYERRTWAALLGLGLISQLAAYYALVYALGHLPATLTSVGVLAQVPLTALLAVPLLGEPLSAVQIAGGMLVLGGIYVVNTPSPVPEEC